MFRAFLSRALPEAVPVGPLKASALEPRVAVHHGVPSSTCILAYDPIQHLLSMGTRDGRVKVYGRDGIEAIFASPAKAPIKFLQFFINKGFVASATILNTIEVWDLSTKLLHASLTWPCEITAMTIISETPYLLVGDAQGYLNVVELDGAELRVGQYNIPPWVTMQGLLDSDSPPSSLPALVGMLPQPGALLDRVLLAYTNGVLVLWDLHDLKAVAIRCITTEQRSKLAEGSGKMLPPLPRKLRGRQLCTVQEAAELDREGGDEGNEDEDEGDDGEELEVCSLAWACAHGSIAAAGYTSGDVALWGLPTFQPLSDKPHKSTSSSSGTAAAATMLMSACKEEVSMFPLRRIQLASRGSRVPVTVVRWCPDTASSTHSHGGPLGWVKSAALHAAAAAAATAAGSSSGGGVDGGGGSGTGVPTSSSGSSSSKPVRGGGRLYVFGGDILGMPEMVTVVALSTLDRGLEEVSTLKLPWFGPVSDIIAASSATAPLTSGSSGASSPHLFASPKPSKDGATAADSAHAILVLTVPGQVHVYDDRGFEQVLAAIASGQQQQQQQQPQGKEEDGQQGAAAGSPALPPQPVAFEIPGSAVHAAKLVMASWDTRAADVLARIPHTSIQRCPPALSHGTRWPVSGGQFGVPPEATSELGLCLYLSGHHNGFAHISDMSTPLLVPLAVAVQEPRKHEDAHEPKFSCVTALDFCALSGILAVGHEDGLVEMFELAATERRIQRTLISQHGSSTEAKDNYPGLQCVAHIELHRSPITCIALATASARLASASRDGMVCLFDIQTLTLVKALDHPLGDIPVPIVSCSFVPLPTPPGSDGSSATSSTASSPSASSESSSAPSSRSSFFSHSPSGRLSFALPTLGVTPCLLYLVNAAGVVAVLDGMSGETVAKSAPTTTPAKGSGVVGIHLLDAMGFPVPAPAGQVELEWIEVRDTSESKTATGTKAAAAAASAAADEAVAPAEEGEETASSAPEPTSSSAAELTTRNGDQPDAAGDSAAGAAASADDAVPPSDDAASGAAARESDSGSSSGDDNGTELPMSTNSEAAPGQSPLHPSAVPDTAAAMAAATAAVDGDGSKGSEVGGDGASTSDKLEEKKDEKKAGGGGGVALEKLPPPPALRPRTPTPASTTTAAAPAPAPATRRIGLSLTARGSLSFSIPRVSPSISYKQATRAPPPLQIVTPPPPAPSTLGLSPLSSGNPVAAIAAAAAPGSAAASPSAPLPSAPPLPTPKTGMTPRGFASASPLGPRKAAEVQYVLLVGGDSLKLLPNSGVLQGDARTTLKNVTVFEGQGGAVWAGVFGVKGEFPQGLLVFSSEGEVEIRSLPDLAVVECGAHLSDYLGWKFEPTELLTRTALSVDGRVSLLDGETELVRMSLYKDENALGLPDSLPALHIAKESASPTGSPLHPSASGPKDGVALAAAEPAPAAAPAPAATEKKKRSVKKLFSSVKAAADRVSGSLGLPQPGLLLQQKQQHVPVHTAADLDKLFANAPFGDRKLPATAAAAAAAGNDSDAVGQTVSPAAASQSADAIDPIDDLLSFVDDSLDDKPKPKPASAAPPTPPQPSAVDTVTSIFSGFFGGGAAAPAPAKKPDPAPAKARGELLGGRGGGGGGAGGAATQQSVDDIRAKYGYPRRQAVGDAASAAAQARDKLVLRGEKLKDMAQDSEELASGAADFAALAAELAKKEKRWW